MAVVDTSVHTATTIIPAVTPAEGTPAMGMPLPPPTPPAPVAAVGDATSVLNVVEQTSHAYGHDPYAATAWAVHQPETTGEYSVAAMHPFHITPLVVVATLAAIAAIGAAATNVATIEITGGAVASQTWKLNDFASNNMIGGIIAAVLLLGGSFIGATGRRVGAGLAGGAGLALAGLMGMALGQVTALFDSTEVGLLQGGGTFTLTTTQEIGFWLAVGAAALGALTFVLSLRQAGHDGRPPLQAAVGIVGALGTLLVVVGPLIPMHGAQFGDQFSNDFTPPATLLLRLLVLVLIAIGGLIGFLTNRRWGLGLALGAISVGVWQWITSISESGDLPLGIAGGNPGATEFTPHIVTTVGVVVMVLAAVAGLLTANQQRA